MLDAMFLIQRSLYLRLKQTRHPHGIMDLYVGSFWGNRQWGKYTNSGNDRVITYPIAFSELYYANVISPDNCETFVYGISNTNINYRLCNGYNDDRWNGTQTSRLFAVGR